VALERLELPTRGLGDSLSTVKTTPTLVQCIIAVSVWRVRLATMPIRIDRRLLSAIRRDQGAITIEATAVPAGMAVAALEAARLRIRRLDGGPASAHGLGPHDRNGPKFVSEVTPTKRGAVLWLDGGETPIDLLLSVPVLIAEQLEAVGVTDGRVGIPPPSRVLDGFDKAERWATLRLFPVPPRRPYTRWSIPREWVSLASEWLGEEARARSSLVVSTLSTQWGSDLSGALAFMLGAHDRMASNVYVVTGDPRTLASAFQGYFQQGNIALSVVGLSRSIDEVSIAVERLKQIARQVAGALGYACINVDPSRSGNLGLYPGTQINRETGRSGRDRYADPMVVSWLCDEAIFDAFAWQVLGPGHLLRFDQRVPATAVPLPAGRVEFALGTVEEWLNTDVRRERVLRRGRRDLAPCLLSDDDANRLITPRRANA